jgi:hypothetical protein
MRQVVSLSETWVQGGLLCFLEVLKELLVCHHHLSKLGVQVVGGGIKEHGPELAGLRGLDCGPFLALLPLCRGQSTKLQDSGLVVITSGSGGTVQHVRANPKVKWLVLVVLETTNSGTAARLLRVLRSGSKCKASKAVQAHSLGMSLTLAVATQLAVLLHATLLGAVCLLTTCVALVLHQLLPPGVLRQSENGGGYIEVHGIGVHCIWVCRGLCQGGCQLRVSGGLEQSLAFLGTSDVLGLTVVQVKLDCGTGLRQEVLQMVRLEGMQNQGFLSIYLFKLSFRYLQCLTKVIKCFRLFHKWTCGSGLSSTSYSQNNSVDYQTS